MKQARFHSVVAFLVLFLAALAAQEGPAKGPSGSSLNGLAGNWTGGFWLRGNWVAVNLRFSRQEGMSGSTADLVFPSYGGGENALNVAVEDLKLNPSGLHLVVPGRAQKVILDGRQEGSTITGRFAYGSAKGSFGLTRVAVVTPESLEKLYGAYRVSPGRVISILRGWSYARTLNYVDYGTGRVGTLWPSSQDEFFSGEGLAVSFPVALRVSFVRDAAGSVTGLTWHTRQEPGLRAQKIQVQEERIRFNNGDVTLGGTLILPASKGPHPAIVITPGDYGTNRDQLRLWAHHYVSHGMAAFVFDARGGGESAGPVNSSSFPELADDVLAAVRALQARADINPRQIGLFGFSNSAFTVSLAASRSKDIAFLILQSLVGVLPWKQESFRAERQLRVDGFPDAIVKQGADFMRRKYEVARTGTGWEQLQSVMEQARGAPWLAYTNPPATLERLKQVYERNMLYDPIPALERLKVPVLAFWGGKDTYLPIRETVGNFKQAMAKSGNKDYVIKVYPGCDHSLLENDSGSPSTGGREKSFAKGLWAMETDWLRTHGIPLEAPRGERQQLTSPNPERR